MVYERGVTVAEAAEALGISPEAVRMRIKRGMLRAEKHAGRQRLRARVTVPGRGAMIPSVQSGGGYSLRARTEKGARGDGVEEGALLVAVGGSGVVSVVPGVCAPADPPSRISIQGHNTFCRLVCVGAGERSSPRHTAEGDAGCCKRTSENPPSTHSGE